MRRLIIHDVPLSALRALLLLDADFISLQKDVSNPGQDYS